MLHHDILQDDIFDAPNQDGNMACTGLHIILNRHGMLKGAVAVVHVGAAADFGLCPKGNFDLIFQVNEAYLRTEVVVHGTRGLLNDGLEEFEEIGPTGLTVTRK